MDTALSILRSGTHDLHQTLETKPTFARLLSAEVTTNDYIHGLTALYNSYALIEPALMHGLKQHFPFYEYQPRQSLLQRDLLNLGYTLASNSAVASVPCQSKAEILGMLYVIEGSSLGGQMLMRHLKQNIGESIDRAMAFYSLDGRLDLLNWSATKRLINDSLITQEMLENAVAASRTTFSIFISQA